MKRTIGRIQIDSNLPEERIENYAETLAAIKFFPFSVTLNRQLMILEMIGYSKCFEEITGIDPVPFYELIVQVDEETGVETVIAKRKEVIIK